MDNQTNYQYIHVGVGMPNVISYTLSLCKTFTSTCLRNYRIRSRIDTYVAGVVDDVFEKFRWNVEELKEPFHTYKCGDRIYLVYRYSDNLYNLIKSIFDLAIFIKSYKWTRKNKWNIVNGILAYCNDIDSCIAAIDNRIRDIKEYLRKLRKAGKKALITRFERNTQKCKPIIDKYFSDLYNYHVYDAHRYLNDLCVDKSYSILSKFFDSNTARRYSNRICDRDRSVYLFARDGIFGVKTSNHIEFFRIFYDGCVDNEKYAVVKLIGATVINDEIDRIEWVAVLGYDKHTNQIFLHYIPRTLLFRDIETCRLWILGLVDNYGNTVSDVELVEV
jgi:hypothetical protein